MMYNLKVIKASIKDIPYILDLEKKQNIHFLSEVSIKEDLNNSNYLYLLLKYNEKIIGYIAVSFVIDTMDILSIVISKDYQKMGFATYLLNYIFDFCRKNDIKTIFLEVRISNLAAIKLYEKCGFIKISKRTNYYIDTNEDALIYKKEI